MGEDVLQDQKDVAGARLGFRGVSAPEEALYRRLLNEVRDDGGARCVQPREEDLADRLVELGLAVRSGVGGLRAAGPARAVDQLIDRRLNRHREELEQTVQAHGVVESLVTEMASLPTSSDDAQPVKQLEGLTAVREAIDELTFFARSEKLTVNPVGVLASESIEMSRPLDLRGARRSGSSSL
ncbi:hypothetical protein [Streptomyces puniciscabiei]|uniref:hypothetical protein n=1 Tax=Streptomyces puniciscabiei TaxID=164348 RepID=UPI00114E6271|nr:hypothetical protein [Streptomyces puniciscabiei]